MRPASNAGAYGFRLRNADADAPLPHLIDVGPDATVVTISWEHRPATESVEDVTPDRVLISAAGKGRMEVLRREPAVRYQLPEPATAEAVVHPLMTAPLAILARWRGDVALHAGAAVVGGAAFAVSGVQTAGKSSMLAAMAEHGFPIAGDDLVVVHGEHVLSGPRCIDLRPDTAERFEHAEYLGIIGARPRYRLTTPPAPAAVPFGGAFELAWSADGEAHVEPLSFAEKIRLLHGQDYAGIVGPPQPDHVMQLLGLPMWRLRRPRDWSHTDAAVELLAETALQVVASQA